MCVFKNMDTEKYVYGHFTQKSIHSNCNKNAKFLSLLECITKRNDIDMSRAVLFIKIQCLHSFDRIYSPNQMYSIYFYIFCFNVS